MSNLGKPKIYNNDVRVTKVINFLSGKLSIDNFNNIKLIRNNKTNQAYIKVKDKNGNESVSPIYKWSRVSLTATIAASLIIGTSALSVEAVQAKTFEDNNAIRIEKSQYQNDFGPYYLKLKDKEISTEFLNEIDELNYDTDITPFANLYENGSVARDAILSSNESSSIEEVKYERIISSLKEECKTYGERYGVDPNLIAALMMTEAGGYEFDINNDNNYAAIGYLQLNGNIWNGVTFKVYDFIDKCDKVYTIDANKLMGNKEEQVKLFAIMLQSYAQKENYNVCAMIEEHNKGCGTVDSAIKSLKQNPDYQNKEKFTILSDNDASLLESTINKNIGDGEYYNKTMGYINMLLKNHEFSDKEYITIYDRNNNQYNYSLNITPSRSR